MRTKTIEADVIKTLDLRHANSSVSRAQKRVKEAADDACLGGCGADGQQKMIERMQSLLALFAEQSDAHAAWKKIPKDRRKQADDVLENAKQQLLKSVHMGEDYSGERCNKYSVSRTECDPSASSATEIGDQYSRSCTYSKTDVTHMVTLDYCSAVSLWLAPSEILRSSSNDGMPLLDISRDTVGDGVYTATWTCRRGKRIESTSGWIAYDAATKLTYHSTESAKNCLSGLKRKVKLANEATNGIQTETVSIATIRRLTGWCREGCSTFVAQYLPEYEKCRTAPVSEVRRVAETLIEERGRYVYYAKELLKLLPA